MQPQKQIVEEHQGKPLEALDDAKIGAGFIWRCIRISASIRECFRIRGTRQHAAFLGGTQIFSKEVRYMEKLAKVKQRLTDEGIMRDNTAGYIAWTHESRHLGHGEMLFQLKEDTPRAALATGELRAEAIRIALETNYGVPSQVGGDALHEMFGPRASNYHLWLRKVKQAFDPNDLSDALLHITAKGPGVLSYLLSLVKADGILLQNKERL